MKVGQKVKLVARRPKKNPDKYNPDCVGEIISLDGKMNPIIVEWETGVRNSYSENELEKVFDYNNT